MIIEIRIFMIVVNINLRKSETEKRKGVDTDDRIGKKSFN